MSANRAAEDGSVVSTRFGGTLRDFRYGFCISKGNHMKIRNYMLAILVAVCFMTVGKAQDNNEIAPPTSQAKQPEKP